MRVFIGLDLGTSSVKAAAIDAAGRLLASAGAAYPTATPHAGWAEQDPADWTRAARQALRELVARLPADARPEALALAGQMPTLAVLDPDGQALCPAIVWYDGRAEREAAALLGVMDAAEWYRRSGVVLDAHYLAPMYRWVSAHQPAAVRGAHTLCSAKDTLLHALTGAWLTDPSTASGYGIYAPVEGHWDAALCAAAQIDPAVLPRLADAWTVAGGLREEWRESGLPAGLPVIVGAADSLAGVLGCGAASPGTLAAITGTSTAMLVSAPRPLLDPGGRFLLTPHALPDLWGLEMDLMATGASIAWLARSLGLAGPGDVYALAEGARPGADGLVILPYLAGGEQGSLWDAAAPGAVVGLSLAHGPAELARALIEGIAYEMRRCLLAWVNAGVEIREVVLAGASGTGFFARLLAAVLGRPVRGAASMPASAYGAASMPASAYGAALIAGIGAGAWSPAQALALAASTLGEPIIASNEETSRYAALYERYDYVSAAVRQNNPA